MQYESKYIEKYHTLMIVWMVLTVIGGFILAYVFSREYHSFVYYKGGYYETNWVAFFTYLIVSCLLAALEYAICNVTCELFNNVCIIKKNIVITEQEKKSASETEKEQDEKNDKVENHEDEALSYKSTQE